MQRRPGANHFDELLRRHLTAVKAATEICGATVKGAEMGSRGFRWGLAIQQVTCDFVGVRQCKT